MDNRMRATRATEDEYPFLKRAPKGLWTICRRLKGDLHPFPRGGSFGTKSKALQELAKRYGVEER